MEKLLNEFTVNRSIAHAWTVLTDVERIAPCMPGAELKEIEGDIYRGVVKVKLGPISTAFKGQATFVEKDDDNHRAVLKGEGRDTGGKGNADALITAQLEAVSAHVTKCVVSTDLHVSGKVAQFGRGIMGDVSAKLMTQFAHNLNTMLDAEEDDPAEADAIVAEALAHAEEVKAHAAEATVAAPASTPAEPVVRTIQGPAAEPIELSEFAGSALVKRLVPALGGLVLLLLVLRRLRK
ncbi:MAG: SRPBCC family protein [Actinobacteria bacterium]|nr:SRPBCC family protein [Actinomycetota bacterium]